MSDGREEREELERRREEEKRRDREDRVDRGEADPWEPERVGLLTSRVATWTRATPDYPPRGRY